ncbi:MAG: ribose-5-phosphate isomerase RpiA [Candidatus Hydrogenedentota bacterium]|nr:MAG: ribose-5-phosphate isomerase RpiA [Candidatus Hydrogenedentota bacterium]
MDPKNELKRKAAYRAVDFVESGMAVGLGTGSTAAFALERIAELLRSGQLKDVVGIPSSVRTGKQARALGIPLVTFDNHPEIDLTIDGADEVDPDLNLIKGSGGALLREKILAQCSRREIIVVDESKLSPVLGTKSPLPVEVIPFGWQPQANYLESLGSRVTVRTTRNGERFKTDQGNMIQDCTFSRISEPAKLADRLSRRAGIVEHGLFIGLVSDVIVAGKQGIRHQRYQEDTEA